MPRVAKAKGGAKKKTAQKKNYGFNIKYQGQGAYTAPRSAAKGEDLGRAIGSLSRNIPVLGHFSDPISQLTAKLGGYLGDKLGTYMGWGAYSVKNNSLIIPEGNSPAAMHSDGRTTRICHREYITDIITSSTTGAFKLQSFQIQPGYSVSFPWLSSVAQNFQKYRILGAIVEYKSGSGDAITGTNTALGEVMISSNYNCADGNFVNRVQMENTQYTSSAKPSESFVHIIECDPDLQAQNLLYVNTKAQPLVGMTINECNWVNVQVATVGMQGANVNVGSLYITYDIEFVNAIDDQIDRLPKGDYFSAAGATVTGTNMMGTVAVTVDPANSLGGSFSGNTYSFNQNLQQGLYKIEYFVQGTAAAWTAPGLTLVNCVLRPVMGNDSVGALAFPQNGLVASQGCIIYTIEVTGANATVTLSGAATIPTSVTLASFMIDIIDGDFYHT